MSTSFLFAHGLMIDHHFSPHSAAADLVFFENYLIDAQNKYKDRGHNWFVDAAKHDSAEERDYRPYNQYTPSLRYLKGTLRFFETFFIWPAINATATVVQHEIFGHGYRARDFGKSLCTVNRYWISPFGGATAIEFRRRPTLSEKILIDISGVEADAILGHNTCMHWLETRQIDGRMASLGILSLNTLRLYIETLNEDLRKSYLNSSAADSLGYYIKEAHRGHDIASYLLELNALYNPERELDQNALLRQTADLKFKGSCSFLLNPFNYYGYMAIFNYLWYNSAVKFPLIDLKYFQYLPAYSLALSPFGPENVYKNYFVIEGRPPMYLYFKEGEFANAQYYGIGFESQALIRVSWGIFGLKCDAWSQPPVATSQKAGSKIINVKVKDKNKLGIAVSLIYKYDLSGQGNQAVFCQLGYKTKGYVAGESVLAAPILKVGLKVQF